MLKKEQEEYLKDTFGMDLETLKTALTSEDEVEVTYKSGTFLDDEGLEKLKSTVSKTAYNDGKTAGVEIKAKELKEKFGYDVEGKDLDKLFEFHGNKILESAKVEPNKKVSELSESLKNLQKQYELDISEREGKITSLESEKKQIKSNNDLLREIPEGLIGINSNQFATLAKSEYNFEYDDNGNFVAKKGDKILKDKLENPLKVKDVLSEFATVNKWFASGGRGGGNEAGTPSGFETMNDVMKHLHTNKIQPMSPEGQELINKFKNK